MNEYLVTYEYSYNENPKKFSTVVVAETYKNAEEAFNKGHSPATILDMKVLTDVPAVKAKDVYYVINVSSNRVVEDVTEEFLSRILHYKDLFTISLVARLEDIEEARSFQKENGGFILRAVE
jgi:hypothetical protein